MPSPALLEVDAHGTQSYDLGSTAYNVPDLAGAINGKLGPAPGALGAALAGSPTGALGVGTGFLIRSAGRFVPQPSALMEGAVGAAGWVSSLLLPRVVAGPLGDALGNPPKAMSPATDTLRLEIKLLTGADLHINIAPSMDLDSIREAVARACGVPPRRQVLVVAEERVRHGATLGRLAKRMGRSLAAQRDLRSTLISWINFVFLPEAVNRELYGRGVIGLVKASTWYQQLQESQQKVTSLDGFLRLQVETLAGQVVAVEADPGAALAAVREGIEREVGVLQEQQRLIVLERTGPGPLTHVANSMLLRSLTGLRAVVGAAVWAGASVLGGWRPDDRFTVSVRTHTGRSLLLDVTGEMTINELREMVEGHAAPEAGLCLPPTPESVHEIVFPELPPLPPPPPQIVRVTPT